jgi:hypothetical protein
MSKAIYYGIEGGNEQLLVPMGACCFYLTPHSLILLIQEKRPKNVRSTGKEKTESSFSILEERVLSS